MASKLPLTPCQGAQAGSGITRVSENALGLPREKRTVFADLPPGATEITPSPGRVAK
jgi:hypothetical protein